VGQGFGGFLDLREKVFLNAMPWGRSPRQVQFFSFLTYHDNMCSFITDHNMFFRCLLSDESKQVATIIKSMLQLALELRSCFQSGDTCDLSVNQLSNLQYLINFSQVFSQFHTSYVI
jgi:hypothetical protein